MATNSERITSLESSVSEILSLLKAQNGEKSTPKGRKKASARKSKKSGAKYCETFRAVEGYNFRKEEVQDGMVQIIFCDGDGEPLTGKLHEDDEVAQEALESLKAARFRYGFPRAGLPSRFWGPEENLPEEFSNLEVEALDDWIE